MSYYCLGRGHVCCHCSTLNQWPKQMHWQSGCGGRWLVRCHACRRVASTLGNRSFPVREHDLRWRESEGPDFEGQPPSEDFDASMLHADVSGETDRWYPRDPNPREET